MLAIIVGCHCAHGAELPDAAKGLVVLDTPVTIRGDGPKYDYQGLMPWSRWGRVKLAEAAVFHYTGPASQPAIDSTAHGPILSGINLWRREFTQQRVKWDGSVGYRFANPASLTRLSNASIAGFDTGILFADGNHVELFLLENIDFSACRVCFRNEESQAVAHHFQNINQQRECEVMFQWADIGNGGGGNISFDTITMQWPALMFDIEKSNSNSCTFRATNIKIDGGAKKDWRLIRQREGPLNFYARGHIGLDAVPAADAIDVADASHCDVELFWRNRIWPRDFEHDGTAWRVKE